MNILPFSKHMLGFSTAFASFLYFTAVVSPDRMFFSGCKRIMYNFGLNRITRHTAADKLKVIRLTFGNFDIEINHLIVMDMEVILILPEVLMKMGTKANQIMHVVYMLNPINFDSLKPSGIFRVKTAWTVHTMTSIIG